MDGSSTDGLSKRRIQDARRDPEVDTTRNKDEDAKKETKDQVSTSQAQAVTVATTILSPAIITSLFLIFGGCCSNVYTLESIVKLSPASGTLVTLLQFLLTALSTLPSQLTFRNKAASSILPRLRSRTIPLHKWMIYTGFFLSINILNNAVFNYRISIPLHIILRSASPVTSMLVGYILAGRRYTFRQVFAVLLLFAGVVLAALSDAKTKSRKNAAFAVQSDDLAEGMIQAIKSALLNAEVIDQLPGFLYLFSALILAAMMGIYTDRIYDQHGRSIGVTNENLFYSHMLAMPWFAFQQTKLRTEYNALMSSAVDGQPSGMLSTISQSLLLQFPKLPQMIPSSFLHLLAPSNLRVLSLLLANALTQIVCITGVNRLSTETTSLTVTIVLNIRKLVSLLLSIWLFGNTLSTGVAFGALMVFIGGGLYGLSGKKKKSATATTTKTATASNSSANENQMSIDDISKDKQKFG